MRVYQHIDEFKKLDQAIVTIGTFDGVHLGHRKIISRLTELAKENGGESVILTFFPHPRMIIQPEDERLKLINSIKEKTQLLEELGVDHLIITPFTRDFSNLSPQDYIKQILVDKIGTRQIIIGYDHRFGKDREGDFRLLEASAKTFNFIVEEIPEMDLQNVGVSSTKIREAILKGDVHTAAAFLSYPFAIEGLVIKGDQIGRKIGFPTANLLVEEKYKLIPADGIYVVSILTEDKRELKGMGYIGNRPTVNGMTRNIEVNIFDFNEEIYGQKIIVRFVEHIRGDMRFNGLDELTAQIQRDKDFALNYFSVN